MPDLTNLDDLIAAEAGPRIRPCKYLRAIADLTDTQREQLDGLTAPAVARVMTSVGRAMSENAVRAHREQTHNCG